MMSLNEEPPSDLGTSNHPTERLCVLDTQLTACSLEFCPSNLNFLACGLYQNEQLKDDGSQTESSPKTRRVGRCVLYELCGLKDLKGGKPKELTHFKEIQRIESPAVLDQRWTHQEEPILITADAEGHLNSFQLKMEEEIPRLQLIENLECAPSDVLCLSLDISDKRTCGVDLKVVASLSNGEIVLFNQSEDSSKTLTEELRWVGHRFEPWTCGFDYWDISTILTGGDDCEMKVWDTRNGVRRPVLVNKKFEGGVTAIRSHHLREYIFAVGSYDQGLRIFDKRNFSKPLWNVDVGGGIWRLKWHNEDPEKLLVASMHDGFKILNVNKSDDLAPKIHSFYDGHSSLAYGADWGKKIMVGDHTCNVVGSCSFYDHSMQAWYSQL